MTARWLILLLRVVFFFSKENINSEMNMSRLTYVVFWISVDITAPSSSGENKEWYFFIPEEENSFHRSGKETTRFVGDGTGFWKLIGEERPMFNINGQVFALKRNLTYFSGNPSEPRRTHWKMELFRLPLEFYTSQNPKEKVSHGFIIIQLLLSLRYTLLLHRPFHRAFPRWCDTTIRFHDAKIAPRDCSSWVPRPYKDTNEKENIF